jgi:hypothetical protein
MADFTFIYCMLCVNYSSNAAAVPQWKWPELPFIDSNCVREELKVSVQMRQSFQGSNFVGIP